MTAAPQSPTPIPERHRSNPFATRFTRPGRVPPLDATGRAIDVTAVVESLPGGVWAIEAPHGHGKTTLLLAVLEAAAARGRGTAFIQVRSWRDAWPALTAVASMRQSGVVGVDGWEQLPPGAAAIIRLAAWWQTGCVLATTHRPLGLRVLARCRTTPALLTAIIDRLPGHEGHIAPADVSDAFHRHKGNVREALYDLYDRFERRGR